MLTRWRATLACGAAITALHVPVSGCATIAGQAIGKATPRYERVNVRPAQLMDRSGRWMRIGVRPAPTKAPAPSSEATPGPVQRVIGRYLGHDDRHLWLQVESERVSIELTRVAWIERKTGTYQMSGAGAGFILDALAITALTLWLSNLVGSGGSWSEVR